MRLIDADALYAFLSDQCEKETGMYSKGRNVGLNIARSALHDKTITPTIAPPPNDPLTLAELREMDGEPIYVTRVGWKICYGIDNSNETPGIIIGRTGRMLFDGYGKTWFAYRHKPEEGTP